MDTEGDRIAQDGVDSAAAFGTVFVDPRPSLELCRFTQITLFVRAGAGIS